MVDRDDFAGCDVEDLKDVRVDLVFVLPPREKGQVLPGRNGDRTPRDREIGRPNAPSRFIKDVDRRRCRGRVVPRPLDRRKTNGVGGGTDTSAEGSSWHRLCCFT